jgi:hypothetical protein
VQVVGSIASAGGGPSPHVVGDKRDDRLAIPYRRTSVDPGRDAHVRHAIGYYAERESGILCM